MDLIFRPELGREQGSEAGDPWSYMASFQSVALRPNRIRQCEGLLFRHDEWSRFVNRSLAGACAPAVYQNQTVAGKLPSAILLPSPGANRLVTEYRP